MESIITRFDKDNPCWTEELLRSAGEDTSLLPELVERGLLRQNGDIYCLTGAGAAEFRRAAAELFLGTECGAAPQDAKRSLARSKLRILLDNAHSQRWGLKEYHTGIDLGCRPALRSDEIFSLTGGNLSWLYQDSPIYRKIAEDFPYADVNGRDTGLVPPAKLAEWCAEFAPAEGILPVDLLYLSRYDFMEYKDFKGHPNDPLGLINADRFLFVFPEEDAAGNIHTIGRFHLWLNFLRRMQIPGYADCDTQEQFSVSWLVFAAETEAEAARVREQLAPFGERLVRPASPCEIWTISLEALGKITEKQEVISELFYSAAVPVQRDI